MKMAKLALIARIQKDGLELPADLEEYQIW
jgi:hypothetical protein